MLYEEKTTLPDLLRQPSDSTSRVKNLIPEMEDYTNNTDGNELSATIDKLEDINNTLASEIQLLKRQHKALIDKEKNLERMVEEMRQSEERFRLLVANVKEYAIFRLDPEGYIRSWNVGAQRLKQYTEDEIIGKHFSIFYSEQEKLDNKPGRELEQAIAEGKAEDEGWRLRKDGSRFWASVVITPIYNKNNELLGFTKVTRDLTERMQNEQMLIRKNIELASYVAELEQFTYIASHDLKEPLRMVASYVQLLGKRYPDRQDENSGQYMKFIVEGVSRMYSLIDDVLKYSSIRKTTILEEVDMNMVLSQVKASLKNEIQEAGAEFISDQLPVLHLSWDLMMTLFENLISNSLKFRDENRPLSIDIKAYKEEDKFWTFSVKDNGIGIKEDYWDKIFSIFQRLHLREEYPGTGMGLSICQKIIHTYGGKIWLESEPGNGSSFYFTLPDWE